MSEADSRQTLVRILKPLDAISIETRTRSGVPDVNFAWGWIECKWRKTWPRDANEKPVVFEHPFTTQQILRAKKRKAGRGVSLLCVQVQRDWFFFDGAKMGSLFGKLTRLQMEEEAELVFWGGIRQQPLIDFLRHTAMSSLMANDF